MRRIPEEACALEPQRQDAGDDDVVVAGVAVVPAAAEGAPDLLAQVASLGVRQERLDCRPGVGDGPLSLAPKAVGRGGVRAPQGGRQAGEIVLAGQVPDVALLVREQVLAELREERRELEVDGGDADLGRKVELCPGTDEAPPDDPREALLLGRQTGPVTRLVDRLDAPEERFVLVDPVLEGGERRFHLDLDRPELRRAASPRSTRRRWRARGPAVVRLAPSPRWCSRRSEERDRSRCDRWRRASRPCRPRARV